MEPFLRSLLEVCDKGGLGCGNFGVGTGAEEGGGDVPVGGEILVCLLAMWIWGCQGREFGIRTTFFVPLNTLLWSPIFRSPS